MVLNIIYMLLDILDKKAKTDKRISHQPIEDINSYVIEYKTSFKCNRGKSS